MRYAVSLAYLVCMTYPRVTHFDETALRQQRALEAEVTRGRSMWREPRPVKQSRFRFGLRAARG